MCYMITCPSLSYLVFGSYKVNETFTSEGRYTEFFDDPVTSLLRFVAILFGCTETCNVRTTDNGWNLHEGCDYVLSDCF